MLSKIILYLEIIVLLGGPLFLMGADSSILASRPLLMAIGGFYCAFQLSYNKAKFSDIGITTRNLSRANLDLVWSSIALLIVTTIIIVMVSHPVRIFLIGHDPLTNINLYERIFLYVFASAPIQELIFRGYLTFRLQRVLKNDYWIRVTSVVVFTLAHLPFRSPIMLFVSLFLGIMFTQNYLKYKNLFAVSISHGLVGGMLMILRNYYLPY